LLYLCALLSMDVYGGCDFESVVRPWFTLGRLRVRWLHDIIVAQALKGSNVKSTNMLRRYVDHPGLGLGVGGFSLAINVG
jgi:hypothetical protein